MAQDDYFVIVYQVLKYLYDCLKKRTLKDVKEMVPFGKTPKD